MAGDEQPLAWALRKLTGLRPDPKPGETITFRRKKYTFDEMDDLAEKKLDELAGKRVNLNNPGWGINMPLLAHAADSVRKGRITEQMDRFLDDQVQAGVGHDEGVSLAYCAGHDASLLAVLELDRSGRAERLFLQRLAIYSLGWSKGGIHLPCARNSWTNTSHVAAMLGHEVGAGPEWKRKHPAGLGAALADLRGIGSLRRQVRDAKKRRRILDGTRLRQPIEVHETSEGELVLLIHRLRSYDNCTPAVVIPRKGQAERLGTPFTQLKGTPRVLGYYPFQPATVRYEPIDGSRHELSVKIPCRYGSPGATEERIVRDATETADVVRSWTVGGPGEPRKTNGKPQPPPPPKENGRWWTVTHRVWKGGSDRAATERWYREDVLTAHGRKWIRKSGELGTRSVKSGAVVRAQIPIRAETAEEAVEQYRRDFVDGFPHGEITAS